MHFHIWRVLRVESRCRAAEAEELPSRGHFLTRWLLKFNCAAAVVFVVVVVLLGSAIIFILKYSLFFLHLGLFFYLGVCR